MRKQIRLDRFSLWWPRRRLWDAWPPARGVCAVPLLARCGTWEKGGRRGAGVIRGDARGARGAGMLRGDLLSLRCAASAPAGNPRPRLRPRRATRCGCTARSTRPGRRGRPGLASVRPEASRFSASSASYCPFSVKKGETGRSKGTLVLRNQVIVLLHYFLFT